VQIQQVQPALTAPAPEREPRLREAAKDFEALLIGQILRSFRSEIEEGCLTAGGSSAGATMLEFAEQHLAQVLSRQGGLGLHEIIVQGLRRKDDASTLEAQAPGQLALGGPPGA
jgi:Rod binding domain-containing protein